MAMTARAREQSIDVGQMIEGIRRWVEIESPTSDVAAVNRMMDQVGRDLVIHGQN